jgi:hypothetical protein
MSRTVLLNGDMDEASKKHFTTREREHMLLNGDMDEASKKQLTACEREHILLNGEMDETSRISCQTTYCQSGSSSYKLRLCPSTGHRSRLGRPPEWREWDAADGPRRHFLEVVFFASLGSFLDASFLDGSSLGVFWWVK